MRLSRSLLDAAFEDRAPASNAKAAVATDVAIRAEAQHAPATADAARFAKPASSGFFGLTGVRENKRAAREELREAVERVKGLEAQVACPIFGVWQPPEGARETGKDLAVKAVAFARLKGLDKGAEGKFVKLSATVGGSVSVFRALGDEKIAKAAEEAASAIRRVVEGAWAAVRPAVAIASRALAEVGKRLAEGREWERLIDVGLADAEFRGAFNVAGRPLYFVYTVGDVEYGAVKAKGVKAVAFVSGEKTLRIEVLAENIERLDVKVERVRALGGEWVRLATFEIETETGAVHLIPRVETSVQVKADVGETERRALAWLAALALTDAGKGGKYLESPDLTLHFFYTLAVGETEVRVARVVFTVAGPTLHLEARASAATRVDKLLEEVKGELASKGLRAPDMDTLRNRAKSKAVEIVGKYAEEVMRIARETRSVEELRVKLVQLFDEVAREAAVKYKEAKDKGEKEIALWMAVGAVVAKKFFAENVDDPMWWALLLLGDGVVKVRDQELGFSAVPTKAAEAVMYVFARSMGVPLEVQRGKGAAVLNRDASRAAVEKLFRRLEEARVGNVPARQLLTAVAEWWLGVGTGGSDPPKLLSLLALRELAASKEGKWLRAWLSYEALVTPVPEEVEKWLDSVYRASVKPSRDPSTGAVSFDVYFERGGERFKLHTDFLDFRLYCDSCSEVSARRALEAVAEWLRPAVERLAVGVWPRWYGNALDLPASVGWPLFLRLWRGYNMSLRVEDSGRELLRVEVLDVKSNGEAKFRLWYYKWRETRPDQPYVDIEITYREKSQKFIGRAYANEAKGILREHLAEIAQLLRDKGMEGIAYYEYRMGTYLQFTGAFRDSVLAKLGIEPELSPGEPPDVQHLGGLKFKVGDREVEFDKRVEGKRRELYAELKFPTGGDAERFASSLKAVGVYAEVRGNTVRLDSDSFLGLLAATNATPPGLTLLYGSDEDDFRVYASMEGGRMRFYFAVKHGDVWRATEGVLREKLGSIELWRKEREVLEAIRGAVIKALKMLGRSADVGEPKEDRDEKGNVKVYCLYLFTHHLTPFLEHVADRVEAVPAEVRLEGRRIVITAGGFEAEVEFKLLKRHKAEYLIANDIVLTLALYKSLRELGVRVEITPKGVKVDAEVMWALVVAAVERSTPSEVPADVMPGVELLNVHSASGMKMYIFRAEGAHYYFVVKTREGWRTAGGKYVGRQVTIHGQAARIIAKAINAIYREMGVERRAEVKYDKDGTPYVLLTNEDLRLLGPARRL